MPNRNFLSSIPVHGGGITNDPLKSPIHLGPLDGIIHWFSNLPWLEIFFLYFMLLSGAIAMTVSYSISELAENCGDSATALATVFLSEAFGGLMGGASSVFFYHEYPGNWVLIGIGSCLGCILITMPFITNAAALNLAFFGVGASTLMIQIGCIHLMRRIQQESAGHWLALTQAAISAGGTIFFILDWVLNLTLLSQFIIMTVGIWTVSIAFIAVPFSSETVNRALIEQAAQIAQQSPLSPAVDTPPEPYQYESNPMFDRNPRQFYHNNTLINSHSDDNFATSFTANTPSPSSTLTGTSSTTLLVLENNNSAIPTVSGPDGVIGIIGERENVDYLSTQLFTPPHYYAELVVGCAAALVNGVTLTMTAYFESYVEETGIESTDLVEYQLTLFWGMITVGRLLGTVDQYLNIEDDNIVPHTTLWLLAAGIKTIFWFIFWLNATDVWVATALLGFFLGPVIGYIFDWVNRLTVPSEASTTILLLVTFVGGHLVIYFAASIWSAGAGPRTLIVTIMFCLFGAIPFLWWGRDLSYLKKFQFYNRVPTVEF